MRKIFMPFLMAVLAVFTVVSSCKPQELATTPGGENPLTFSSKGSTVTAVLQGNTTTGYSWEYKIKDKSIVEYVSDEYKSDAATTSDGKPSMVGAGGKHTFVFKALKSGTTYVTFDYAQHWKKGKKAGVRLMMIMVDDQLNATAAEVKPGKQK
jgi:predicted secreted protein